MARWSSSDINTISPPPLEKVAVLCYNLSVLRGVETLETIVPIRQGGSPRLGAQTASLCKRRAWIRPRMVAELSYVESLG